MARKSSTSAAGSGPTTRQRGYAVIVKCFIRAGDSLVDQADTLKRLAEIEAGDISGLTNIGISDISVAVKPTSRKVETAA